MTRPWREISKKHQLSPERVAAINAETQAMVIIEELTRIRDARSLTQSALASSMQISQARVSQIERQHDLNLSTLSEYVRGMGGELQMSVVFPDETIELIERRT